MSEKLDKELLSALKREDSAKILSTADEDGVPSAVFSPSLHVDKDGNLVHLELFESSNTTRNLTRGIWFSKKVSVSVRSAEGREWSISGTPFKVHIAGSLFQRHYEEARKAYGDADLAGVWLIEPNSVVEETHSRRLAEQDAKHPFYRHLDRLAKGKAVNA